MKAAAGDYTETPNSSLSLHVPVIDLRPKARRIRTLLGSGLEVRCEDWNCWADGGNLIKSERLHFIWFFKRGRPSEVSGENDGSTEPGETELDARVSGGDLLAVALALSVRL